MVGPDLSILDLDHKVNFEGNYHCFKKIKVTTMYRSEQSARNWRCCDVIAGSRNGAQGRNRDRPALGGPRSAPTRGYSEEEVTYKPLFLNSLWCFFTLPDG
jgi:hypothetical protein